MRRLLAFAAAAAVARGQGLEAGNCSCGLIGTACDVAGWVNLNAEVTPTPVTSSPGGQCNSENGLCVVVGSDAKCACWSGFKGKLCDEMVDVLELNLGLALALGVALLAGGAVLQLRHDRLTKYQDYAFTPSATTEGFASKRVLLAYRLAIALLGVGVNAQILFYNPRPDNAYRAYTYWNWTLLTCFFILGSYLSVRACTSDYHSGGRTETNLAERVFYVMMQVELPNTVLIALVVWLVLFPAAAQNGFTGAIVNPNSFIVHGANVAIMLVEFALNGLRFNKRHVVFAVMWGALYVSFTLSVSAVRNSLSLPEQSIYPFLTASSSMLAAWILGLLIVLVLFYTAAYQLNRCKRAPQGKVEDVLQSSVKVQGGESAEVV